MATATQRALADRALRAAGLMEALGQTLLGDLQKYKDSPPSTKEAPIRLLSIDLVFNSMLPLAKEIRLFEKNLRQERIRGRS
jgi:hypothetical protein